MNESDMPELNNGDKDAPASEDSADYDEFEDFDPEDYLHDEDCQELDFEIDETWRGDPERSGG